MRYGSPFRVNWAMGPGCSPPRSRRLRSGLYLGPSGGAIGILGGLEGPVPCAWAGCSAKQRARNHGQGVCEVVNHGGRRTGASGCGPSSALERAPRSSRGVQGKVPRRSAVGLFLKVPENFVHDLGLGENGDDFHFRAASRTNQRGYLKDFPDETRPASTAGVALGGRVFGAGRGL